MKLLLGAADLYKIAVSSYESTQDDLPERAPRDDHEAIVAIVFAALALEGFINEFATFAVGSDVPVNIRAFGTLAQQVEENQGSPALKLLLASALLVGRPYEKGQPPYQDFQLLMRVRNAIAHPKMEEFYVGDNDRILIRPKAMIEHLRSKNITALNPSEEGRMPLLTLINTRAAAKWACNTTADMVQSIMEMITASRFKLALTIYANVIRRVT